MTLDMQMGSKTSQGRTAKLSQKLLSIAACIATVTLAGCGGDNRPASALGGECKIFPRAETEIEGKTATDQRWIDNTIESGVGGCGWQRPAPRPPEIDATPIAPVVATIKPVKKLGVIARVKARLLPKHTDAPQPLVAVPPVFMAPFPVPAPPQVPRDPVLEFLHQPK